MNTKLVEELRATFEYHEGGYLIRKSTGSPCGQRSTRPDGYAQVRVNGRLLYAHRIIYAIVYGEMPDGDIDHIDQNPMNSRIENLRDVSHSENLHNYKKRKTNKSGFTGVSWYSQRQKWRAQICVDNKNIYLGLFDDFEEAVEAWKKAKIHYHPSSPEAIKYANEGV